MKPTRIELKRSFFGERPGLLLEYSDFKATAFRYTTGICGLHVQNSHFDFVLLPFYGQQLWKMKIDGKEVTMKSIFEEPEDTDDFSLTYGGFLIHCGMTAMGNPSVDDTHPLHGELSGAAYKNAYLETGEDEKGRYLAAGGTYDYKNGLEYNYSACPRLVIYEGESVAHVSMTLRNKRCQPMEFMYMCHINWLPQDGGKLIYSAAKDKEHIKVFQEDFGLPPEREETLQAYTRRLMENPLIGDVLDSKTQVYDPEICTCISYQTDEFGYAHSMLVLPDEYAYYIRFETEYLPNGLRWVARTGDEDAIGFALPTTGNHLGQTYAKEHGLMKEVPAKGNVILNYDFGLLNPNETVNMKHQIESLL